MSAPYTQVPRGYPPPARRRKRWPWVLLTVLVVIAALLVAADRIALHFAENEAGSALQSSQDLAAPPDVSVAGFPFLTQVAAGHFDDVTVTAADVRLPSSGLLINSVEVHLHDVTVPSNFSSVHAATAVADASIGYDSLSEALGATVSGTDHGRVAVRQSVDVAGQTLRGRVTAVVHASSSAGISFARVAVQGVDLPDSVVQQFGSVFSTAISLAGLPFGVTVTGLTVRSDAVHLQLTGHDLDYRR